MKYSAGVMLAVAMCNMPLYAEEAQSDDASAPISAGCEQDLDTIRNNLKTAQNTSQKLQSEWQQRLSSCEAELMQTQQSLSGELDKQAEVSKNLSICQTELEHAKQIGLKTRLAPAQGGSATANIAKTRASSAAQAYMARLKTVLAEKGDKYSDSVLLSARRELLDAQHLLLQIEQGVDLYTIRRNDTLSIIATAVYGKGKRWRDIADANQHILPNPNQLEAGLTLMIPR